MLKHLKKHIVSNRWLLIAFILAVPVYCFLGEALHVWRQDFISSAWVKRLDQHQDDPQAFLEDVNALMIERPHVQGLATMMCRQFMSIGAYSQAQSCYLKLWQQDGDARALKNMGLAYLSAGEPIPHSLKKPLTQALKKSPKDVELLYLLMCLHYDLGQWQNVHLLSQALIHLLSSDHPIFPRVIEMQFAAKNALQQPQALIP
ncbi:MAG: tetratricopeptide repeat protein [Candidatus Comchoanobacterales bacterium]